MNGRRPLGPPNGNGDELGKSAERCNLGDDCPFEAALEQLKTEQHDRIKAESALSIKLDTMIEKMQTASLQLEHFERKLRDYAHDLEQHIKRHRYFDLAVISIGAAIGGFLAKLVVH